MSNKRRIILLIIFLGLSLFIPRPSDAQCPTVNYNLGRVWEVSRSMSIMNISTAVNNFTPRIMTCLATELRKRFHDSSDITVFISSSREVAQRFEPAPVGDFAPAKNAKEARLQNHSFQVSTIHGYYSYSAKENREYLIISPLGSDTGKPGEYDTSIDLPTDQPPACKLQLMGRCVLSLDTIAYPDDALLQGVSGAVTITGEISPGGKPSRLTITNVQVSPPDKQNLLLAAATRNLASWLFEPAHESTPIRIGYTYVIDPSLVIPAPYREQMDVHIDLPNQVTIRGNKLDQPHN